MAKGLKTLKDAFENGAFDKDPKGMKEGSKKEEALDKKQQKAMPKGGPGPQPFPPFKPGKKKY